MKVHHDNGSYWRNIIDSVIPASPAKVKDAALSYLRSGGKLSTPSSEELTQIRKLLTQSTPPIKPVVVSAGLTGMRIDALGVGGNLFLRFNDGPWRKGGAV